MLPIVDDDGAVAVEVGAPVRSRAAVPFDRGELRAVVELEADVIGDSAAEIRDPPEEPVGCPVGRP
jgi:hypothetical protein